MTDLGYGMQGMGEQVLSLVSGVAQGFNGDGVTYVEIGVGEGTTLTAISKTLQGNSPAWRAIGIELPNGYSFNRDGTEQNVRGQHLEIEFVQNFTRPVNPKWNLVTVCLMDSHRFLGEFFEPEGQVQIALIDGCHGKKCATQDFLLLEPVIDRGGVVMFHDFGPDQVGQEQPHCPEGLDVLGACRDLGLLNDSREGWKFIQTIVGDKQRGSGDMGVFQKL